MTILAHVENGQIVLPGPLEVPDGTKVEVSVSGETTGRESPGPPINIRLANVIGKAVGLPADFAENHDHYIHGVKKNSDE